MASLKDVAKLAGVSVATASYVLRRAKPVSAVVEARVWQAARQLSYQPNRSAQALRTGRSQTLGLIVPDLTNPYFPELVQAIETSARALGYALLLIDAQNDGATEREGLKLLASYGIDGLLWVPVGEPQSTPFPTVLVDRASGGFDVVQADHYQGGRLLAAHALELGHRRIGLLSGPAQLDSARKRRQGLLDGLAPLMPLWECEVPYTANLPRHAVEQLTHGGATLVICANDAVAIGALQVLKALGRPVPDEVSLLGFDDLPWATLIDPPLSTVRQAVGDLGRTAVTRLLARIEQPDAPLHADVLPVELIARRSARPVGKVGSYG